MKKKFICAVCGYIYEGDEAPEKCPICKAPASKFSELKDDGDVTYATVHKLGDGKLDFSYKLYGKTWPLLQLGTVQFPTDFTIAANDPKLNLEMNGSLTARVPDELFKINTMGLKDGAVTSGSRDSSKPGGIAYTFRIGSAAYTQYHEENFFVIHRFAFFWLFN